MSDAAWIAPITRPRAKSEALLIGRIYDDRGNRMSPSPCPQAGRQVSAKQSQNISLRANPPARCPYSWSRFSKKYASTAGCATRGFPQFASWGSQCTLTDRRTLLREICSSRIGCEALVGLRIGEMRRHRRRAQGGRSQS
jgi:hypothetical protein